MRAHNHRITLTPADIQSNRPPVTRHNACTDPCDTVSGPCICGAWHTVEEWNEILKEEKEWSPYKK